MQRTRSRDQGATLFVVLVAGLFLSALAAAAFGTWKEQSRHTIHAQALLRADLAAHAALTEAIARARFGVKQPYSTSSYAGSDPATAGWKSFGEAADGADYLYRTPAVTTQAGITLYTIRCWGRVRTSTGAVAQPNVSPDQAPFTRQGWLVRGYELTVRSTKYPPVAPLYVGHGGMEDIPSYGYSHTSSAAFDPNQKSTWGGNPLPVNGAGASGTYVAPKKAGSPDNPVVLDAREHPEDFAAHGGAPDASTTYPLIASQNEVGQFNSQAFLKQWGSRVDVQPPLATATYPEWKTNANPALDSTYSRDPANGVIPNEPPGVPATYPLPVDQDAPDPVQFVYNLWSTYGATDNAIGTTTPRVADGSVVILPQTGGATAANGGFIPGTSVEYGTTSGVPGPSSTFDPATSLDNPKVVLVTGQLLIPAGKTVKGYGVLVIRDAFDPSKPQTTSGGNTATTQYAYPPNPAGTGEANWNDGSADQYKAQLVVNGTLEWTGMVVFAGYAPAVRIGPAGVLRIVGAFLASDAVKSGGEKSLDGATCQFLLGSGPSTAFTVNGAGLKLRWCRRLFVKPDGTDGPLMKFVSEASREIIGIREL